MLSSRLAFVVVLVWLTSSVLAAGQQPVPQSTQAVTTFQESLKALLGAAVVSDVTLTGTVNRVAGSDDENGTATLRAMSSGDSRLDLSFASGNRSEIRNSAATPLPGILPLGATDQATPWPPQPVGEWSGPDGVWHGIANHNLLTDATWFFPAFTVGNLVSSQNYVLSYVGPETLNGQSVLHLQASQQFPQAPAQAVPLMQQLSQMDIYLSSTTLLPVALAFSVHPDDNALINIATEIYFSGYQTVNGIQVPFHVQKYLNNSLALDLQFNNVTLNSGLSAAAFNIQ